MLEKKMIIHCAPTLAGLKTANMFNYKFSSIDTFLNELRDSNDKLNRKGVYVEVLKIKENRALVYVYRKKRLENDLKKPGVRELLWQYGYQSCEWQHCREQHKRKKDGIKNEKNCSCILEQHRKYRGHGKRSGRRSQSCRGRSKRI